MSEQFDDGGSAAGVSGVVSFATDVFDSSTVARFVGWFERVLSAVVGDSSVVVGDVVLADEGQAELVGRWGVGADVGVSGSVVGLLAGAVARDPGGVAVVSGSTVLTYGDLDVASNRLARVLIGVGVGPEAAVVVALDRGVSLVVALWAVWKAGGVYVPVDAADPGERVGVVVAATDPVCVLTAGGVCPAGVGSVPVIDVDGADISAVSGRCGDRRGVVGAGGARAWGVCDFHVGVDGDAQGGGADPGWGGQCGCRAAAVVWVLASGSRVLMAAAPTFDASVFEVLLAAGSASGLVVSPAGVFAGAELAAVIDRSWGGYRGADPDGVVVVGSGRAGGVGHGDHRRGGLPGGVGAGRGRRGGGWSMPTGRPSSRFGPAPVPVRGWPPMRRWWRSGRRSSTRRCGCWIRGCGRVRRGWWVSCMWVGCRWRGVMWVGWI